MNDRDSMMLHVLQLGDSTRIKLENKQGMQDTGVKEKAYPEMNRVAG